MRASVAVSMSAVAVFLVVPQIASGDYTSVQHNLIGAPNDTSFDGSVLRIYQNPGNNLTLWTDAGQITGTVADAVVDMQTNFQYYNPTPEANYPNGAAWFGGGTYTLTFTFTPTGGTAGNYSISGPMDVMKVGVTSTSPALSTLTGEGRWTATSINLPGPDMWVTGPDGWSGIHALTMAISTNLANYQWQSAFDTGNTQYNISPSANAIPEPSALALLLLGVAALLRRRGA